VAEVPETRFATTSTGDRVAFQASGHGPIDVLLHSPPVCPVDLMWEEPRFVHSSTRLSSFCRHIWFDRRGTGASDRVESIEGRIAEAIVEDMIAVIDEVGCERVTVVQLSATAIPALFAATHPQRTRALVMVNCGAQGQRADDYPYDLPDETDHELLMARGAPDYATVESMVPSRAGDRRFQQWFNRAVRLTAPQRDRLWLGRQASHLDLRGVLGSVQAPTLVVASRDARLRPALGRYLADHIEGAQYVEVEGQDLLPHFSDAASEVFDAIESFLTGDLPAVPESDRVLATVLFTDLVSSTPQLAEMGDRRWRNLIATHDALVRTELDRFRGQEVRFDGDGVVATFDGPGRAIRCACAIRDALGALGLEVRAGLHTGEIELRGDDIAGIAVHVGKRVSTHAGAGEVLVSRTVADLVAGSDIELHDTGEHELKGVSGTWRLFSVASA
jgi:class 3 adenylate cyclase